MCKGKTSKKIRKGIPNKNGEKAKHIGAMPKNTSLASGPKRHGIKY